MFINSSRCYIGLSNIGICPEELNSDASTSHFQFQYDIDKNFTKYCDIDTTLGNFVVFVAINANHSKLVSTFLFTCTVTFHVRLFQSMYENQGSKKPRFFRTSF